MTLKTAEYVSVGHPDKIADYISSYLLDRFIEQDKNVKYAVEVMIKDNTVVLGGEVTSTAIMGNFDICVHVKDALCNIGYNEEYAKIWGDYAINVNKIKVFNMIGIQSPDIYAGVKQNGWGDQGVFVGYACKGDGLINRELYLARRLASCLYRTALESKNLGLDIKTQITTDEKGDIITAIVAIPMLEPEDLTDFIVKTLGQEPKNLIVNGTGIYKYHSSIADCGVTGRKLACDFYSTACPIGGGSPWTKDPSKADLTLNIYARHIATNFLKDNDECFVYLSSCIGKSDLPSATVKIIKDGWEAVKILGTIMPPEELVDFLDLRKPIYAEKCISGLLD